MSVILSKEDRDNLLKTVDIIKRLTEEKASKDDNTYTIKINIEQLTNDKISVEDIINRINSRLSAKQII